MSKGYPYKIQIRLPARILGNGIGDTHFFGWMKENIGTPYERWMTSPVMLETIDDSNTLLVEVCFLDSQDAVLTALKWS